MDKQVVLVVDDDGDCLELLRVILEESVGVQTVLAQDGAQALEIAQQVKPHLVILDVVLPRVNGMTVLVQLKSSEATRETPVILMSAWSKAWQHAFLLGADDYIEKPFEIDDLIDKVREQLHGGRIWRREPGH